MMNVNIKQHLIFTYLLCMMLYHLLPSLPCLSEKTYVAPHFSLKVGRSAMACFLVL